MPGAQLSLPSKWRTQVQHAIHLPQQPLLAVDKVRHVGEAIAVVLAESLHEAQDAAELVTPTSNICRRLLMPRSALRPETALIHEEYQTNLDSASSQLRKVMPLRVWRAPPTNCAAGSIRIGMRECRWNVVE